MRKKLLALGLISAMTLSALSACAKPAQPAATTAAAETTAAPETTEAPETTAAAPETTTAAPETTTAAPETSAEAETEAEADEENYDTGDASLDDIRNQDSIGEKEILVVSFGTSFNDSRRENIGGIEAAVEKAFPEWSVRRGFTSQIIIDHVERRDGFKIDNLKQALDRAVENGVKELVIQPTHLMSGFEYNDVVTEAAGYADAFEKISVGKPMLNTDADFERLISIITADTAAKDDGETAIIFMGHGTEAESNGVYAKLQEMLTAGGHDHYFIGTVEAEPSLDDVLAAIEGKGYTKVVLEPLMVVAGDHANNDMAGDEEDSWKSILTAEGYEVTCILRGLGELEDIRAIYAAKALEAIG